MYYFSGSVETPQDYSVRNRELSLSDRFDLEECASPSIMHLPRPRGQFPVFPLFLPREEMQEGREAHVPPLHSSQVSFIRGAAGSGEFVIRSAAIGR